MKHILTLFLILLVAPLTFAERVQIGDLYYNLDSSSLTAEVTYSSSIATSNSNYVTGDLKIPESVSYDGKSYSVTSIGSSAFSSCSGLSTVEIPNSVTSIGNSAFLGCRGLTSVIIPNSITSIGNYLFLGCNNLTKCAYPSTIANPFLTGICIQYPADGAVIEDGIIYGKNKEAIYFAPFSLEGEFIIPNTVTLIGDYTFYGCSAMTSVSIGNSVSSIGKLAFYECSDMTSVTIGNSVTSIGDQAFYGCNSLTGIYVESGNTSYASRDGVLYSKNYETLIKYPGAKTGDFVIPNSVTSISNDACYNCRGITGVIIGNSVSSIGERAFDGCNGLVKSAYPSTVSNPFPKGICIQYPAEGAVIEDGIIYGKNKEAIYFAPIDIKGEFIIPNTVTLIGNGAFRSCSGLTSVSIPNSVTYIGNSAFKDCSELTSVSIPNSVTSIEDQTFYGCSKLTSVTIPNSVTSIGNRAFSGCSGLTSVTIPNSVTSIGNRAFSGCRGLTSIEIPNSVTSIGDSAFSGCSGLTSIEIPNSVTSIGDSAFSGCSGLTSMTIGNSVTTIGNYAFYGCSGLTSVEIPNSVTSIGEEAFRVCRGLTSVKIGNSVTSIGGSAFNGCSRLTNVIFPNSVTYIGNFAFAYCSMTSVTIPNSVTYIGENAFVDCSGLTSVEFNAENCQKCGSRYNPAFPANITNLTFGDNVKVIPRYAFWQCRGLTSVEIPNSVTSIGDQAFYECNRLASVTIGNSVTSIGNSAFYGCSRLTSVSFPNSVTTIGDRAFYECNRLTSVEIGNSVTSIGNSAFYGCSGLTSVTIPNSVIEIGDEAFYECSGLTSVKIGNSVTSIGAYAFYECSGLTSVTIGNSVTSIGAYAFYNCNALTSVTLPKSITYLGNYSFYGCSLTKVDISDLAAWCRIDLGEFSANPLYYAGNLTLNGEPIYDLVVPEGVQEIKNYVFGYWESLNSVSLPASLKRIGISSFQNCINLKQLTFNSRGPLNIGSKAFSASSNLTLITCNTAQPPVSDSYDVFATVVYSNAMLNVPEKELALYNATVPWNKFSFINSEEITRIVLLAEGPTTISVGSTTQLVLVSYPDGEPLTGAVWSVSDPRVAIVDITGLVTAKSEGTTIITATYRDLTASCQITVTPDMSIIIDPVMTPDDSPVSIFTLSGQLVKRNASQSDIDALTPGIYIIGGKKIIKR